MFTLLLWSLRASRFSFLEGNHQDGHIVRDMDDKLNGIFEVIEMVKASRTKC